MNRPADRAPPEALPLAIERIQHWHNDESVHTVLFELADWLSTSLGEVIDRGRAEGAIGHGPPAKQLAATLIWSAR